MATMEEYPSFISGFKSRYFINRRKKIITGEGLCCRYHLNAVHMIPFGDTSAPACGLHLGETVPSASRIDGILIAL